MPSQTLSNMAGLMSHQLTHLQRSPLSTFLRRLLIAAILLGLGYLALPWFALAIYAVRLSLMPAPVSVLVPVEKVERRVLRDTWHAARPPNRRHEGIDIFAKKGTPIIAATEGIVLRIGESALGGNVVWQLGPGGHYHYYAHLDRFADASVGDRVRAGGVLGYVGNTGNARTTPPHLHYGIYTSAGAINPYPLLAGKERR